MTDSRTRFHPDHPTEAFRQKASGAVPAPADDIDAEICLRDCSEAFGQLAALLHLIKEKAGEHSDLSKLAGLGWTIANDMERYADASCEQLQNDGVKK